MEIRLSMFRSGSQIPTWESCCFRWCVMEQRVPQLVSKEKKVIHNNQHKDFGLILHWTVQQICGFFFTLSRGASRSSQFEPPMSLCTKLVHSEKKNDCLWPHPHWKQHASHDVPCNKMEPGPNCACHMLLSMQHLCTGLLLQKDLCVLICFTSHIASSVDGANCDCGCLFCFTHVFLVSLCKSIAMVVEALFTQDTELLAKVNIKLWNLVLPSGCPHRTLPVFKVFLQGNCTEICFHILCEWDLRLFVLAFWELAQAHWISLHLFSVSFWSHGGGVFVTVVFVVPSLQVNCNHPCVTRTDRTLYLGSFAVGLCKDKV